MDIPNGLEKFLTEAYGTPVWLTLGILVFIGLIIIWFKCVFKYLKTNFLKILITILYILVLVVFLFIVPWYRINRLPSPTPEKQLGIFIARFRDDGERQNRRIKNQLKYLFKKENFKKEFYVEELGIEIKDFEEAEKIGNQLKGRMIVFGDIAGGSLQYNIKILGESDIFDEDEITRESLAVAKINEISGTHTDTKDVSIFSKALYGIALYEKQNYEKAKRIFLDIDLEKLPIKKDAFYSYIGNCDLFCTRYEEAVESYNKAISINSKYAKAWSNKGVALVNLKKFDEAIKCYDKAISINPENAEAFYNKGAALVLLKKYDEAIKCFDKAISINPEDTIAWCNKGATLTLLGKYDEAIECFDKAISINPEDAFAWCNKGAALGNMGKTQEAIRVFEKALSLAQKQGISDLEKMIQAILNFLKKGEIRTN